MMLACKPPWGVAMLNVNYLHILHFSLKVLLWEPLLCWSGRGFYSCGLGSSPLARACCTQSCPGKSSPSLPAGAGSAGPFAEVALRAFGEGIWSSDRSAGGDDWDTHATWWQRPGQQGTQLPPRPLPVSLWGQYLIFHPSRLLGKLSWVFWGKPGNFRCNKCALCPTLPSPCSLLSPCTVPWLCSLQGDLSRLHPIKPSISSSPATCKPVPCPGPSDTARLALFLPRCLWHITDLHGLGPLPPAPGPLSTPYTLPSGGSHSPPRLQWPLTGWQLKVLIAQSWPTLRLHGL